MTLNTTSSSTITPDVKVNLDSVIEDTSTNSASSSVVIKPEPVKKERIVILPEGALVPAGSHVRFNFETGQRELIIDDHGTSRQYLPTLFDETQNVKSQKATTTDNTDIKPIHELAKKFPLGNKWRQKYDRTHVDGLLEQLGKERVSGNNKVIISLLDELEEEAHNVNTGAGLLHSEHLSQMTLFLNHKDTTNDIKRAVLGVLQAALHNNKVALSKAQEIELLPKVINVLREERNKWWSDIVIIRKTIFALHSMLTYQINSKGNEEKEKSFKTQFVEEKGDQELTGVFDKSDELTKEKIIDILVVVGKEARKLINRLNAESKEKMCQKHALECK